MVPTLDIKDAKGVEHAYEVRRKPTARFAVWTAELVHVETGAVYAVSKGDGWWICSCPSFGFAKRKPQSCKHTRAVEKLLALTEALVECKP